MVDSYTVPADGGTYISLELIDGDSYAIMRNCEDTIETAFAAFVAQPFPRTSDHVLMLELHPSRVAWYVAVSSVRSWSVNSPASRCAQWLFDRACTEHRKRVVPASFDD